ncbi:hypothetical protein FGU65_05460 [Methanoculleus sp. FWC-SCC1]|uniref:DUF155 domain-containing protein n=1 Tax=Methanoculleus frigidifontis TaxID=2584085 RepID=A0ABT8M8T8_9EURY|nr:hypothetical protein [Methanoculleus sp. FWC-SCC1]MDN7024342.1 hypothetical protein [Methanoculleus sp. FWC-SCC1]
MTDTYAIRFYRIYDAGDLIDLDLLERRLAVGHTTARARFTRVSPKSVSMGAPPLVMELPPVRVTIEGREWQMGTVARIYDIGAISLCFTLEEEQGTPAALQVTALQFAGQKGFDPLYAAFLDEIRQVLAPHIGDIPLDPDFYEDYTIHITDRTDPALDPVVVLLGEDIAYSAQTRDDTLKYSSSYGAADRTILSWDAALLIGPASPGDLIDLIDLIEYALVQTLEFRYYDRVLTVQMERMYDDIEAAEKRTRFVRTSRYHGIMTRLMETQADISEITDKVDNLIKITEDVYYARVYAMALSVLRISQWRASVDRRIAVIHRNYTMLSDEVNIHHSHFLEVVIILLIAFEIFFLLLERLGAA